MADISTYDDETVCMARKKILRIMQDSLLTDINAANDPQVQSH